MSAILVLGSKPEPALPPASAYDRLACANGSGASAAKLGLPEPALTVMSAILTSGIESGRQTLTALRGLTTDELHFFPRPPKASRLRKRLAQPLVAWRTRPSELKKRLQAVDYRYRRFVDHDYGFYQGMIDQLCADDVEVTRQMQCKQPSTGLITILLALSRSERVIVAGFSFELTHAYDRNPEIDQRGTRASRHADTDITILRCLSRRYPGLTTSEAVVSENTSIPIFTENSQHRASPTPSTQP
jgi:hypothetical protein